MQYKEFQERRAYVRFMVAIPLSYFDGKFDKSSQAVTKDISVEGIGVLTHEALMPGEELDLCIKMLDNNEKIHVKGKIIWSEMHDSGNYRAGIEIKDCLLKPIPLVLRTIVALKNY